MYLALASPIAYPLTYEDFWTLRGLGDVTAGEVGSVGASAVQIANIATSNEPVSTQVESSIGAGLLAAAPFAGPAAPFLAVAGVVAEMLAKFGVGSGCGSTCVLSTQYANQAEAALGQNIATYFSLPAPRTQSQQQAAETIYASVWSDLVQQCGSPPLAGTTAGQHCISDRQQGSCAYKQTATSSLIQYPGEPQPGECWNWYSGYYQPIAEDPVVPDTPTQAVGSAVSSVESAFSSLTSSSTGLLLLGGVVLVALAMVLK